MLYTDLSGRGEGGRWGLGRGQGLGQSPHRGLHRTLGAGTGVVETEMEDDRWGCVQAAGGSERRNKKQLRPFLITLCIFALLQVTLVKSLERKSQRIQQTVAVLHPMKACFSKE